MWDKEAEKQACELTAVTSESAHSNCSINILQKLKISLSGM